jgi:hypothetical protein
MKSLFFSNSIISFGETNFLKVGSFKGFRQQSVAHVTLNFMLYILDFHLKHNRTLFFLLYMFAHHLYVRMKQLPKEFTGNKRIPGRIEREEKNTKAALSRSL